MSRFLIFPTRFSTARLAFFLLPALISACGGGGGDGSVLGSSSNSLLATQITEIQPDNEADTSSVFVQLGSANSVAGGLK